jgi:hypothetical protein
MEPAKPGAVQNGTMTGNPSLICSPSWIRITGTTDGIPCPERSEARSLNWTLTMNLAASLVAVSLLLLLGLGVVALFLAGRDSRSANEDDPPAR